MKIETFVKRTGKMPYSLFINIACRELHVDPDDVPELCRRAQHILRNGAATTFNARVARVFTGYWGCKVKNVPSPEKDFGQVGWVLYGIGTKAGTGEEGGGM